MGKIFGVDVGVVMLGVVSFLTDVSSEMIFSVFSIFFTVILGASAALLGLIEGLADFSASSLDYIAGYLSDKTGKRKSLAILGYSFSTVAKIILIVSNSVVSASIFRVIERLGKSFRGPPRDAWIASLTTDANRGVSFGVHKALDKSGAIIGPLAAYFLLSWYGENAATFKTLFIAALIPAILAVIVLLIMKDRPALPRKKENIFTAYKDLGPDFKRYVKVAGVFSLGYFSFGFLLLKAYLVGFAVKDIVLLYALFNLAFVVVAAPFGKLGDRIGRRRIIAWSYIIYALMCVGFLFASAKWHIIVLFILFGIFYAIDESQSKAFISDLERERRATAIGVYNFTVGIIYLPASLIAGFLWKMNPNYAFGFAAITAILGLAFLLATEIGKRTMKTPA